MSSLPSSPWPELKDRLSAELTLKLILTLTLNAYFYVPYALLQRYPLFAPAQAPQVQLDRLIPFVDSAVYPYLSLFLLMPVGPLLMSRRAQLLRYGAGIFLIETAAFVVFLLWPTWCVRPETETATRVYRMLIAFDLPLNAFPSLHAAFAVYSALWAALVLREFHTHAFWTISIAGWCFLILLGTLLTKQHHLIDILAGGLMGFAFGQLVFPGRTPALEMNPTSSSRTESNVRSSSTAL